MMEHEVLVALRLGVVAAGLLAALWSLRLAARTTGERWTYLLLAGSFGLLALGSVVEGILFEFARWDLSDAHTAEALIVTLGFVLVLVAILRSRV